MGNQHARIIKALEEGERLTSLDAWKKYSIARLSARISELKAMGYQIETFRRETFNQFNEPTHYTEYSLRSNEQ